MPTYTFSYLSHLGTIAGEQQLDIADDDLAMEIARIFDYVYGIRVRANHREVGTVWPAPIDCGAKPEVLAGR